MGDRIGETQLEMLSRSHRRFAEARTKYDAAQFHDVDYREFVADPVGTTRGIYAAFGLDWSPQVATAVEAMDAESRQGGKRPAHKYSLADYGLTAEQVRAAFAER